MRASGVANQPAHTAAFPARSPADKRTADRRLITSGTELRMLDLGRACQTQGRAAAVRSPTLKTETTTPRARGIRTGPMQDDERREREQGCEDAPGKFPPPTREIPQGSLPRRRQASKALEFLPIERRWGWRRSCPWEWRVSRVSSRPLFDRADAGSRAKRQPAVRGLVSRHHVRGVPASGLNDVPNRERRRQLRRRRGGRVCSRGRAAHRCWSGRAERRRGFSVPIAPFAY